MIRIMKFSSMCMFASATAVSPDAVLTDGAAKHEIKSLEDLHHLLPKDMQHTLAGLLENRMGEQTDESLEDAGVNALLSGLLHDELEERSSAADALMEETMAKFEAEQQELRRQERERAAERSRQEDAKEAARDAARAAHAAELKQQREEQEAHLQQAKAQAESSRREFEAKMEAQRQKMEERRQHHAAMQEQHAKNWERVSSILQQVHTGLEELTHGWQDVPFWDDFFQNTSTSSSWEHLALDHLKPALQASAVQPSHKVLFLEPRQTGLAERLAAALHSESGGSPAGGQEGPRASVFGAEGAEAHDAVVEVGLLDAMAMGGQGQEASRVEALRHAVSRLSSLVKPGGTWLSVSVVPPTLRAPLLGRLVASGAFVAPAGGGSSGAEDPAGTGTHAITLQSPAAEAAASPAAAVARSALRGSAQVANLLLYGSAEAHVWAYRLRRAEEVEAPAKESDAPEESGLFSMIRQQRPGTRDDL